MNQEFENDPLLVELKKSAKQVAAPELDVEILLDAAKSKTRLRTRPLVLALAGSLAAIGVFASVSGGKLLPPANSLLVASDERLGAAQKDVVAYGEADGDQLQTLFSAYEFSAADDLQNSGEPVSSYLLGTNKSSLEVISLLKEYFEIPGNPREITDLYSNGKPVKDASLKDHLTIGDDIKQASAFPMGEDGAVGFTYSDSSADSKGTGQVPSKTEAIAEVIKLSALFGLVVAPKEVHFVLESKDYLAAVVKLSVDGRLTPINWVFAWRDRGKVSEFSGLSTSFKRQATPQIIDPTDAVSRAGDGKWAAEAIGKVPNDWYQLIPDGLPTLKNGGVQIAKVPVSITKTELGTGWVQDNKGSMWLLPSYLLYTDSGFACSVIAVQDFQKR